MHFFAFLAHYDVPGTFYNTYQIDRTLIVIHFMTLICSSHIQKRFNFIQIGPVSIIKPDLMR